MKKLILAGFFAVIASTAQANLTNTGINGERVRVGDQYGQIVAKLGQPVATYDYTKNVNGRETSVREVTYTDGNKTVILTIENGKVVLIKKI